jgi:hypothetical protein
VGLTTIFYCLRFETSLFITSYHSQREPYRDHPLQQFVCCNLHITCHSNPRIHSQVTEVLSLTVLGMCLLATGPSVYCITQELCLHSCWLTMDICSDFTIPASRHHVTIYFDSSLVVVSESNPTFQDLYIFSIYTWCNLLFTCKD